MQFEPEQQIFTEFIWKIREGNIYGTILLISGVERMSWT